MLFKNAMVIPATLLSNPNFLGPNYPMVKSAECLEPSRLLFLIRWIFVPPRDSEFTDTHPAPFGLPPGISVVTWSMLFFDRPDDLLSLNVPPGTTATQIL